MLDIQAEIQFFRFPNVYSTLYLPNENFEYGYPHSNALVTFFLQRQCKCSMLSLSPVAASCIKLLVSCIKTLISQ